VSPLSSTDSAKQAERSVDAKTRRRRMPPHHRMASLD
jgi:hypothetical protein